MSELFTTPPEPRLGSIVRREPDDGRRWKRTDCASVARWELWSRRADGGDDGDNFCSWPSVIVLYGPLTLVEDDLVPPDQTWRVGCHLGRTVYRQGGDDPSDDDQFLGIFDSADNARMVCELINRSSRKENR